MGGGCYPGGWVPDVTEGPRRRAAQAIQARARDLSGKRIFFMPDSQLEVPLARFLANECGMEPLEVGTPYLHKTHLADELIALPESVRLSEGQDVDKLLERLVTALEARRFFWPEHKADSMRANLENMLRRLPLTETDTRTLHGVIRHLADRPVRED